MKGIMIRQAVEADASGMDAVLTPILDRWGSARPRGVSVVLSNYINHADRLSCGVALSRGGEIVGFQSLIRATPGNPYDLPSGWGFIGTYVAGKAAGQGVGRALFAESLAAAQRAGLQSIDATIGAENAEGLAYYGALGFTTWRPRDTAVGKRFDLKPT